MKYTIIPILLLSLFVVMSCESSHEKRQSDHSTTESADSNASDKNEEAKLTLNNGVKWASDESTFSGMEKLKSALSHFSENSSTPSIAEYNSLGETLAMINKDIISQCSMKGEDHDQLHIVLVPMLANVDVIKNGQDITAIKENNAALSKGLELFFEHFHVE